MSRTSRVVLDTNVVVSAAVFPASVPRLAVDRAGRSGVILLSAEVAEEYGEVLRRPRLNRRLPEDSRLAFLAALADAAELVAVTERVQACRDAKDDKFLELAVGGRATCIVTGDADLLALHPFRGIPIFTPRQFLDQAPDPPSAAATPPADAPV